MSLSTIHPTNHLRLPAKQEQEQQQEQQQQQEYKKAMIRRMIWNHLKWIGSK